jgi:hypothetical protein
MAMTFNRSTMLGRASTIVMKAAKLGREANKGVDEPLFGAARHFIL